MEVKKKYIRGKDYPKIKKEFRKRVENMEQQRIEWIDRAKGIAIFLVLFGHMCTSGKVTAIIYAFHMPLFFSCPVWCFDMRNIRNFRHF